MKKPYIFFDFDGTVLNTNDIIVDSWNATAMHYLGHEIDRETILKTFGETIRYTAHNFFPEADVEEAIEVYRDYQDANCWGRVRLFDGMPELLEELLKRGYRLAVVTSRTKATTFAYLDSLKARGYFDVIITCDDVSAHKPDPAPLLMAIEQMEEKLGCTIEKNDCIMIGDTKFDIGCGNNAGVDTVLIGWSHPLDIDSIEAMGFMADHRIDRVWDLLEIV